MSDVSPFELRNAVEHNLNCKARFVESIRVEDRFEGKTAWEGDVAVFELLDHPEASRAYCWSEATDHPTRRRFVSVAHHGAIDSPLAAVRAAILANSKR